ncbi:hypothetical protein ACLOJK_019678 [Asimina triloba]
MAQIPNLDNAPLNLSSIRYVNLLPSFLLSSTHFILALSDRARLFILLRIREQALRDLLNILRNIRGKKCLAIDPKLSGSLSLIIQMSVLKAFLLSEMLLLFYCAMELEQGVELRHLSAEAIQTECTKVLFLVRSQLNLMKLISSQIQQDMSKGIQREYLVYFVPHRRVVCEKSERALFSAIAPYNGPQVEGHPKLPVSQTRPSHLPCHTNFKMVEGWTGCCGYPYPCPYPAALSTPGRLAVPCHPDRCPYHVPCALSHTRILEEEKVHHLVTIGEYPLYMIPLDEDVLSFELDLAFREFQVDVWGAILCG